MCCQQLCCNGAGLDQAVPPSPHNSEDLSLSPVFQINVPTDLEGSELLGEKIDRREFIDLLKRMLTLDQERRIRPSDALLHSFIMLNHLGDYPHLTMCVALLRLHLGLGLVLKSQP